MGKIHISDSMSKWARLVQCFRSELAVILGTGGRNISKKDALNHVFGYTILNDLTARDLQRSHQQVGFCINRTRLDWRSNLVKDHSQSECKLLTAWHR
jgi:hypothetical protein